MVSVTVKSQFMPNFEVPFVGGGHSLQAHAPSQKSVVQKEQRKHPAGQNEKCKLERKAGDRNPEARLLNRLPLQDPEESFQKLDTVSS